MTISQKQTSECYFVWFNPRFSHSVFRFLFHWELARLPRKSMSWHSSLSLTRTQIRSHHGLIRILVQEKQDELLHAKLCFCYILMLEWRQREGVKTKARRWRINKHNKPDIISSFLGHKFQYLIWLGIYKLPKSFSNPNLSSTPRIYIMVKQQLIHIETLTNDTWIEREFKLRHPTLHFDQSHHSNYIEWISVSDVLVDTKGRHFENEVSGSEQLEHADVTFSKVVLKSELVPSLAELGSPCFVEASHWPLFLPELDLDESRDPA